MGSTEINNSKKEPENIEKITSYINHLEKRVKDIEIEKNLLRSELSKLEYELNNLRSEMDRLCEPPLLTGQITDILDNKKERVIIKCTTNASYIVKVSSKLQEETIVPGLNVALNQRNYTVMEILPTEIDPFIKGMEIIDTPIDASYDEIGGLDEQIQEVREVVELPLKNQSYSKRLG